MNHANDKSLESWIWDAACSIRGAQEAPKFKDFILPLIFTKRLCDVFDDELNRIAKEVGSRAKAFKLVERDHELVRFYLPLKPAELLEEAAPRSRVGLPGSPTRERGNATYEPVWSVIRKLTGKIGESLTTYLHDIAKANPALEGIIDRMDFNATTHGQRDIDDDRLSNLIERISEKRLGLKDVEADIIGRSYEYLIRKFAEGSGQSAGEFFTPPEVARIMARIMDPEPGQGVYDPCCGSAGLLIACEHVLDAKMGARRVSEGPGETPSLTRRAPTEHPAPEARRVSEGRPKYAPLKMHGQEYVATTWAMANMNMIIHDMEGTIEIGDTFKNPKFRAGNRLQTFDRVVSNPMWNQDWFKEEDYDADELGRFPQGGRLPRRAVGRLGLGAAHPRLAGRQRPGRGCPRHRRRLPRQRQRQQKQGEGRPPLVRRAGPDRGRRLPARKPVLQHQRAGHPPVPEPQQARRPPRQALPRQRQPGLRERRPEELHPARRYRADRDGVPGVARGGEVRQGRDARAGGEGGL
jgi:type I restriction enzyme M protein